MAPVETAWTLSGRRPPPILQLVRTRELLYAAASL
jgi:hypothetical protein